ncbi:MAG: hypothetical protein ACMXYG_00670 [Candidatus Woesearchaeota archaeon]
MNKKLSRRIRKHIILFLFIILIIILWRYIYTGIIVVALILLGGIAKIYKQITQISIGFELITPITILFAYTFGIMFAVISAVIMLVIGEIISSKVNFPAAVVQTIIYIIISMLAHAFNSTDFIILAIILLVIRNILLFILGILLLGTDYIQITILCIGSIFFNTLLITWLGEFFVNILG